MTDLSSQSLVERAKAELDTFERCGGAVCKELIAALEAASSTPQAGCCERVREAAARLQAWLDADDATHFGQHEKDLETILSTLPAPAQDEGHQS